MAQDNVMALTMKMDAVHVAASITTRIKPTTKIFATISLTIRMAMMILSALHRLQARKHKPSAMELLVAKNRLLMGRKLTQNNQENNQERGHSLNEYAKPMSSSAIMSRRTMSAGRLPETDFQRRHRIGLPAATPTHVLLAQRQRPQPASIQRSHAPSGPILRPAHSTAFTEPWGYSCRFAPHAHNASAAS